MNKYIATLVFYLAAFIIFYVVNKYSISPQDGGLGMDSVVILVGMLTILVLFGINIYGSLTILAVNYFLSF
jgi:hypothetical protein